jgi:RecB family exonuclease
MAYLALLAPALQQDNAGIKVWQQLQLLAISPQLSEDNHSPKITLATFMSVLDHSFETERFSVSTHRYDSPDTARVIFMPFYEVAWSHCQHILMMACNDVHFPATPNNPTPLLASVRRELNIPLPIAERAVWLHLLLNMNSQSQVYASFTPSESGNPSRMSPWLNGVSAHIKPSVLQVVSVNNNIGLFQSHTQPPKKPYQSYLTINSLPTDISVSRLSKLLQCPYHFALETIFNIKPLNQPDIWPSYLERGNLLHSVLHRVHRHLEHNNILDTNSTSDLIHAIRQAMQDLLQDKVYLSGRYAALIADCERTIITYISAHQAQLKNNWQIAATEMPVDSHHLIHNVRVHGKIDRLQVQQNNEMNQADVYAVLDYKTSSQDSLKKKIKQPLLEAQLTLYAVLLTLSGKKIEQAAYWRLHDGLFNNEDNYNTDYHSKKTIVSVDDLPLQMEVLSKALHTEWQSLLAGKASTRPNVDVCQYCDYSGVCRNAQLIKMADEENSTV